MESTQPQEKIVKEGSFVEIDYTGIIKDSGKVFDTTLEEVGKKEGIERDFRPVVTIVGSGILVRGLESSLIGRKEGEEYEVELTPEDAFGEVDSNLIKQIPLKNFEKEGMDPKVGMVINANGLIGVVRSISGGRVTVDFNHPLAGKKLIYKVRIRRILERDLDKIKGLISNYVREKFEVEIKDGEVFINLEGFDLPRVMKESIVKRIKDHVNKNYVIKFVETFG